MKISSKLSQDRLLLKIKNSVENEPFFSFSYFKNMGSVKIIGKFKGNKFRLNKRIYYRNSFIPYFYGEVVKVEGGSEIIGEFKMHPLVRIFMGVWFAGVGFSFLTGLYSYCFPGSGNGNNHPLGWGGLIPLAMIAFGVLLVKSGQWFERNSKVDIIEFLNHCAGASTIKHGKKG